MKCGKCGKENPGYSIFCGWCGGDLKESPSSGATTQTAPTPSTEPSLPELSARWDSSEMRYCSRCGKKIRADSRRCQFCGMEPWASPSSASEQYISSSEDFWATEVRRAEQTSGPTIGGIFSILAGVTAVGQGLFYLAGAAFITLGGTGFLCLCGGLDVLFGLIAVLGGICALKRESFTMAIIGAVLGMLGLGLLIGFLFGLLALIFIAVSKEEFP